MFSRYTDFLSDINSFEEKENVNRNSQFTKQDLEGIKYDCVQCYPLRGGTESKRCEQFVNKSVLYFR